MRYTRCCLGAMSRRRGEVAGTGSAFRVPVLSSLVATSAVVLLTAACDGRRPTAPGSGGPALMKEGPLNPALIAQGKTTFRFETYGDETFWTDTLRMHQVIASAVSPVAALGIGLKVDADALPAAVKAAIQAGTIDLASPATTVALLKLGAVVGVIGQVNANNQLTHVG